MIPSSDDLLSLIGSTYGEPSEIFEKAYWCQEMIKALDGLCIGLDVCLLESLEKIESENLTSSEYGVEIPTRIVREPKLELIRAELPEVFERAVYITPYDAQKFIGAGELYRIAKEKAGDRFAKAERLNLRKLDEALTPEERSHYIKTEVVQSGAHRIVRF